MAEAEFFEFGAGGIELTAAAVDEDQIRKVGMVEWWSGGCWILDSGFWILNYWIIWLGSR